MSGQLSSITCPDLEPRKCKVCGAPVANCVTPSLCWICHRLRASVDAMSAELRRLYQMEEEGKL